MHRKSALACLAAIFVAAACFPASSFAAPPPVPMKQPTSRPAGTLGPAGPGQPAPDVAVTSAEVLHFVQGHWTPLPANGQVKVGEAILLQCNIGVAGIVPAKSFSVAWSVDGDRTCGNWGPTLHNPPVCELTWPLTTGMFTNIGLAAPPAGQHTLKCAIVDVRVSQSTTANDSAQVPFATYGAQSFKPVEKRFPPLPPGSLHP